ncbi:PREDICTED: zinc finger protein interacting with ribonucleoprotein K-like [Rhagoletis zephyria]|uniref:zinc finger protein interacting with ribonucleoprotein K-like n=1 Tax=Rhagoletis zephyria TaxID=28612 RepID=UPI00081134B7|nr:PREDICTED: zinc finger protein interacting with ribonucleoprotein K-like [Rhagoletis zephyria]XP_036321267.1 zinc finger protein interacting with ribonucleoprotein K-like [Rhagoletis pomonella]
MLTSKQSQKVSAAALGSENTATDNGNIAWKHWCRLCSKEDESNLNIFPEITEPGSVMDTTLATAIGKFFWVNIRPNDEISKFVCLECHTLVCSLTQFTDRVNKVQAMFCALQNSNSNNTMDLNEVKLQYGLLDMEWGHIIKLERATEEKEMNDGKGLGDECDWEAEGNDSKEEELKFQTNDESKVSEKLSLDLINGGLKRKRDIGSDNDGEEHITPIGAIIGVSEEKIEEHILFEKNTTEEGLDDAESLRQLKVEEGDHDENTEQKNRAEREKTANEIIEENNESLQEGETYDSNNDFTSGEQSAQVNRIDSSSRTLKKRRGRPPSSDMDDIKENGKTDRNSEEDTNDNCQTSFKYECNICHKKYKNPTSYRKHTLEKHNMEPDIPDFKCERCKKIYPTERQLELHARTHLALQDKVSVMRQHPQGIHEKKKPYVCEVWGRSMKTLAALSEHKLVHTNDTPYECEVCQKAFKTKARLRVHLETHTLSSYLCSECGLSLNTRRTLQMHMIVHSDAKRYKCDFCPTAFKRAKALKNHLILHTGMRPYKCNFCEKTFSNGSNCRSHKKNLHAQELAEEEAVGKKTEAVTVPELEELRSSTNVVELLIAAWERVKRTETETTKQRNEEYLDENIESFEEETQTQSIVASKIEIAADDDADLIQLQEGMMEDGDADSEVMVVYETITEI